MPTALQPELAEALQRGTPILTPNERAARDLRAQHDALQQSAGLTTWSPANVLSWNAWLHSQWSTLVTAGSEPRLLLNPAQEHLLWRETIAAGPALETLGELDSLATLAASAWSLAATYESVSAIQRSDPDTYDTVTFAAWAAAFRHFCDTHGFLPASELPIALREHLEDGTLPAPRELLLLGFEPPTPARASLLAALTDRGCTLTTLTPTRQPAGTRTIIQAENPQQETVAAAHWIRAFLEQPAAESSKLEARSRKPEAENENPAAASPKLAVGSSKRVAVILPQSTPEDREALESTFRDILAPELQSIAADTSAAPYTFTSTAPLAGTSMVATALDLLRWSVEPLDLETVSALLLSPYLGSAATLPARAEFDAFTLRSTPVLRPELDIAAVAQLATRPSARKPAAPGVAEHLQQLRTAAHRLLSHRASSYADWTEAFRSFLRESAWPGDRPLTAAEFAAAQAWEHVLDSVATLDFAGARVPFATALAAVTRQARSAPAPITAADAPVQIMSPADAAGSTFDAVIFLHATDANWPPSERPHPLLPWPLQRERNMPGTSSPQTAARAEAATAAIAASTSNLLCFFPETDADGEQRLSPLIAKLGLQLLPAEDLLPSAGSAPTVPAIPEECVEDTVPLPPLPSNHVRGGASLLQAQAACAFHAFAEFRLNASALSPGAHGFDTRELGNFLHGALDTFWRSVRTQARLRAMPFDERRETLRAAVADAFRRAPSPDTAWDKAYLGLQKDRMVDVLLQWLDHELQRGPFEVLEREKTVDLTLGELALKIRLDRIDQVDGGTFLVDYKTGGAAHHDGWQGERPDEPQLPLYALLAEADDLQGLAFAKVRVGKDMKWQGHAPPGILPKPAPAPYADIQDQREEWRFHLERLAASFFTGDADVSPKDYPATCKYCAHRLLCRVSSAALATADSDDIDPSPEEADA